LFINTDLFNFSFLFLNNFFFFLFLIFNITFNILRYFSLCLFIGYKKGFQIWNISDSENIYEICSVFDNVDEIKAIEVCIKKNIYIYLILNILISL